MTVEAKITLPDDLVEERIRKPVGERISFPIERSVQILVIFGDHPLIVLITGHVDDWKEYHGSPDFFGIEGMHDHLDKPHPVDLIAVDAAADKAGQAIVDPLENCEGDPHVLVNREQPDRQLPSLHWQVPIFFWMGESSDAKTSGRMDIKV